MHRSNRSNNTSRPGSSNGSNYRHIPSGNSSRPGPNYRHIPNKPLGNPSTSPVARQTTNTSTDKSTSWALPMFAGWMMGRAGSASRAEPTSPHKPSYNSYKDCKVQLDKLKKCTEGNHFDSTECRVLYDQFIVCTNTVH